MGGQRTVSFPVVDGKKVCSGCSVAKDVSAFPRNSAVKTRLQSRCKDCYRNYESSRAVYRRTKPGFHERDHDRHLRFNFNITRGRYLEMLMVQGGRCAICRTDKPGGPTLREWAVDHDHRCCAGKDSCGKCVRRLLCRTCNVGIGGLKDDPEVVYAACVYLVEHGPPLIGGPDALFALKAA